MNRNDQVEELIKEYSHSSHRIKTFVPKSQKLDYPPNITRYHYTSANALMSILNTKDTGNGSLRFTDVRYMNDKSEHLIFVKRLLEYLQKHRNQFQFSNEVIGELLLKKHKEEEYITLSVPEIEPANVSFFTCSLMRHYLFCMSSKDDSLHMWNYYVRNGSYQGYNIGISPHRLLRKFDKVGADIFPLTFYCGDVLYKVKTQEKEIERLLEDIEGMGERLDHSEVAVGICGVYLWEYIESYGLFYKDESFENENEYRIVIRYDEALAEGKSIDTLLNSNDSIKMSYYERNGIIIPCLSVSFYIDAVKQITMSPMLESGIALSSLKDFLSSNGYKNVAVKQSAIPIRY